MLLMQEDPTKKSAKSEDIGNNSGEQNDKSEEEEEEALDMNQDFGGQVEDVPNSFEDSEDSESEWMFIVSCHFIPKIGDNNEEGYENEMGDLGTRSSEEIDRNMWAPNEECEQEQVLQTRCFVSVLCVSFTFE